MFSIEAERIQWTAAWLFSVCLSDGKNKNVDRSFAYNGREKEKMFLIKISLTFHRCAFYFLENLAMPQSIFNWFLGSICFPVSANM